MRKTAFSTREEQIVQLAVDGNTNEDISQVLGISLSTVNTYWSRIRQKSNAGSRAHVVASRIHAIADEARLTIEGSDDILVTRALLELATHETNATAWATDLNFRISFIAQGSSPVEGLALGEGLRAVFSDGHPALIAHQTAITGSSSCCNFALGAIEWHLAVSPQRQGDGNITGCLAVMTPVSKTL